MMTTYFQGYLCEEDPEDVYVLDVDCGSGLHQITIALSTILLIQYVIFLFVQHMLYASNNFQTDLPWGSLER